MVWQLPMDIDIWMPQTATQSWTPLNTDRWAVLTKKEYCTSIPQFIFFCCNICSYDEKACDEKFKEFKEE